jgi:hypothetical protein
MDSIQKHILSFYNEILKSWNNECMEYKVERCYSIQNHILRVYMMKYSNLITINPSSIRCSTVASKFEHNKLHYNLLDASYLMPFLRQTSLACYYNHHPLQQPTLSPFLYFYLSTMYPFLECSCSSARPVVCSPQLVLLLLTRSLMSGEKSSVSIKTTLPTVTSS